jgi:hypothetical protein
MRHLVLIALLATLAAFAPRAEAQRFDRVVCSSDDYQRRFCPAETALGVRLVRQISREPCVRGRSWWRDERGIVVTAGCAAEFEVGYRDDPYTFAPSTGAGGYVRPERLVCKSGDYRRRYCPADIRYGAAALVRQRSQAPCVYGRTWAYDQRGIWVSNGCEGEFEIGYQDKVWAPTGQGRWVRCESRDYTQTRCATGGRSAQLVRQVSRAPCIEGQTWGWARRGIWVDRGCAADFEVF